MAERNCDTCYNMVLSRKDPMFPHYVCLEENTKPEYVEERQKVNGRGCSYWRADPEDQVMPGLCVVNGQEAMRHFPVEAY